MISNAVAGHWAFVARHSTMERVASVLKFVASFEKFGATSATVCATTIEGSTEMQKIPVLGFVIAVIPFDRMGVSEFEMTSPKARAVPGAPGGPAVAGS